MEKQLRKIVAAEQPPKELRLLQSAADPKTLCAAA